MVTMSRLATLIPAMFLVLCACPAVPGVDGGAGGGTGGGGAQTGGGTGAGGGGGTGGGTVDGGLDAGVDLSGAMYDPTHLVDVRIEMAAADWDALRNQTRDLFTLLTGNCTSQPFPSPFTTFDATITVDGTRLPQSTIKKKGFLGSLSATRPSLKLKFDSTIPKQKVSSLDALTLNNAQQDPSVIRQCLGYALFRKAGLRAPRCNFAHVFVNGTDLGVYANVEAVDHDFLQRNFTDASGNLYEGTLSDFNPTFVNTFDLKGSATDRSDLQAVIATYPGPANELITRLGPVVDTDEFIDFWAMETLVRHWDGYASNTNNFFAYHDPASAKFVFIPWGADAVFGNEPDSADDPVGPLFRGELARRLYADPNVKARYLSRVSALLNTVFVEADLRAEVTRMEALIRPLVHPIQASQLDAGLAAVRTFIDERRAKLTFVLANPPAAPMSERPSPCLRPLGTFDSIFSTTWGTLGATNPFVTGPATFTLIIDGGVVPFMYTGASAGLDTTGNDGPRVGVNLVAAPTDGGFTAAVFRTVPQLYPPPPDAGAQSLDLFSRVGYLFQYAGGQVVPLALLGPGTMEFTDAGTTDGGVVAGHLTGQVVSWPFGPGM